MAEPTQRKLPADDKEFVDALQAVGGITALARRYGCNHGTVSQRIRAVMRRNPQLLAGTRWGAHKARQEKPLTLEEHIEHEKQATIERIQRRQWTEALVRGPHRYYSRCCQGSRRNCRRIRTWPEDRGRRWTYDVAAAERHADRAAYHRRKPVACVSIAGIPGAAGHPRPNHQARTRPGPSLPAATAILPHPGGCSRKRDDLSGTEG